MATAKVITNKIANQNSGRDTPNNEAEINNGSINVFLFHTVKIANGMEIVKVSISDNTVKLKVGPMRFKIISRTGSEVKIDVPKSPCKTLNSHSKKRIKIG
ncbi:hypothetical protein D3C78_1524140 [compost metagenome]